MVIGMHRSGASALTEVLTTLGVTVSPDEYLVPAYVTNERGHFEDNRIVAMNDWILRQYGATAYNPWPMRGASPTPDELERVRSCWNEVRADRVNIVKDPRFCLTLPWWEAVWAEQGPVTF